MTISSLRIRRARLIAATIAVIAATAIFWLARSYTFYFDEWTFIQTAPDWSLATYLTPHNEHPSMLMRLVYSILLNTVGLRSYLPY
ncbi:MAG TPA: hypothetical protein VET26_03985, partial [Candidatus Sulfotelmatobacter sp.]|nr:hypothetical protein [Candidatus Sulfotelmatobacter sp.]